MQHGWTPKSMQSERSQSAKATQHTIHLYEVPRTGQSRLVVAQVWGRGVGGDREQLEFPSGVIKTFNQRVVMFARRCESAEHH